MLSVVDKKKLLIILLESDLDDVQLIVQTLKQSRLQFEYLFVNSREAFLNAISQNDPDIILADFELPNYNCLAAFNECREKDILAPFILVTGSLSDEVAVECFKTGIDDYILKDRLNRLPMAITRIIEKKKLEIERQRMVQTLIKSQKRLGEAEKLARMGNWEWDVSSGKFTWSDGMYRIYGLKRRVYRPEYDTFLDFFHPEHREVIKSKVREILSGKIQNKEFRAAIKTGEGVNKVLQFKLRVENAINGTARLKVFGVVQNVTHLYHKEQELKGLADELDNKVKTRTRELSKLNNNLVLKNMEMTNSLRYAQLIQRALLTKLAECRILFPESFVLWLPKDIVSGDFYWHHKIDNKYYIACVDCTGHGVPGAFMSMIGHQLLNKIVIEEGCTEPADVLKKMDAGIINAMQNETGMEMSDGMDIAFCRVDKEASELTFAGALRPLFYHNGNSLKEINGSKFPLGGMYNKFNDKDFRQQTVSYKNGDSIYLTSDGYYSQFGGTSGKKMMKRQFTQLLGNIGNKPIEEQYNSLRDHLNEWKGSEEQVDDVLVIGIKL